MLSGESGHLHDQGRTAPGSTSRRDIFRRLPVETNRGSRYLVALRASRKTDGPGVIEPSGS